MNNERKRELTRLRVRKHRAVKRQLDDDRLTLGRSVFSSNSAEESNEEQTDDCEISVEQDGVVVLECREEQDNVEQETEEDVEMETVEDVEQEIAEDDEDHEDEEEQESEDVRDDEDEGEQESEDVEDEGEQESDNNEENVVEEVSQIKRWVIESGISFVHVDSLLAILRRRLLPQLPKSYKTFLQTSAAAYNIEDMEDSSGENGQFVYFDVSKGLHACVNKDLHPDAKIQLQFNVDGIPIFKSSCAQFWPILCKVFHKKDVYKPFPVAIYFGSSKPKSMDEYFAKFVEEMNILSVEGILINGKMLQVSIQCFICDTPARSMIKCVKGHTGFYACERCLVRGYKASGSMVFPTVDSQHRTDAAFRNREQPQHHNGMSPLLHLYPRIDMINTFLLDSLHLFPLGIGKKLIADYWLYGNLHVRLSRRYRMALSERMEYLKSFVPCEFQRKPRSIKYVAKWKGTELRFFLLYCGPIVLKDILSSKLYKHFLLLHVAYRLLSSPELALKHNELASKYLRTFFMVLKEYYGRESQVMNAHNLLHVADDVKNMKCNLSMISAFPFENTLGRVIKKCIRTPNRPLAQVCRRLHEQQKLVKKVMLPPTLEILKWRSDAVLHNVFSIQKLKYKGFTLSTDVPNNVVLLKTGQILLITKMHCPIDDMNSATIEGFIWKTMKSMYTYPCDSKHLKMWELTRKPSLTELSCNINRVKHKIVVLGLPRQMLLGRPARKFIMPLLHTT